MLSNIAIVAIGFLLLQGCGTASQGGRGGKSASGSTPSEAAGRSTVLLGKLTLSPLTVTAPGLAEDAAIYAVLSAKGTTIADEAGRAWMVDLKKTKLTVASKGGTLLDDEKQINVVGADLWIVDDGTVAVSGGAVALGSQQRLVIDLDDAVKRSALLGVGVHGMIYGDAGTAHIVSRKAKKIVVQKIALPMALFTGLPAQAAGFSSDGKNVWFLVGDRFNVLRLASGDVKAAWTVADVQVTLPAGVVVKSLALPLTVSAAGVATVDGDTLAVTSDGMYASKKGTLQAGTQLTWAGDIRTLADQFCVQCHGGDAGLGVESAWLAKKADIIERVQAPSLKEATTMPPVNTAPANKITAAQRQAIVNWLNQPPTGVTSSNDEGTNEDDSTPAGEKLSFAVVQSTAVASCGRCHANAGSESWWNDRRNVARQAIIDGAMPEGGSPESAAFTDGLKADLLSFLSP